jgi:flagellar export protein FliJ
MSAFRFRAQAALDLRRRELEAAQRELAHAEQDRNTARLRVEEATAAAQEARKAAGLAAAGAQSSNELQWYRFWILRLDHERGAAGARLAARERDVAAAADACMQAKRRCEALERLRTRARHAYDRAELEAERKVIDELAARRFTSARAARADLPVGPYKGAA